MDINIIKCHGSGNDFVLIDEISNNYNFSDDAKRRLTVEVCNRKGALGADGTLFVEKSLTCDARMRIFNADGSEPEMCGNGLRCVGRYVIELLGKDTVSIETMKAKYTVKKYEDIYDGIFTVGIEIDTVSFGTDSLPINYKNNRLLFNKIEELSEVIEFSAVSITNPHLVAILDDIDESILVEIGKKANSTPTLLPKGVNVNFVRVLDSDSIYVKTYERGVGLTKSCGTGMTASSIVTCLKDNSKLGKTLNVYNEGGMIKCIVNRSSDEKFIVNFIGNATFMYKAELNISEQYTVDNVKFAGDSFMEETDKYDKFLHETLKVIGK